MGIVVATMCKEHYMKKRNEKLGLPRARATGKGICFQTSLQLTSVTGFEPGICLLVSLKASAVQSSHWGKKSRGREQVKSLWSQVLISLRAKKDWGMGEEVKNWIEGNRKQTETDFWRINGQVKMCPWVAGLATATECRSRGVDRLSLTPLWISRWLEIPHKCPRPLLLMRRQQGSSQQWVETRKWSFYWSCGLVEFTYPLF